MDYNIIRRSDTMGVTPNKAALAHCRKYLEQDGWALLRGFDMDMQSFSDVTKELCRKITFDPAREMTTKTTQKVDAGLGPIGLHIENGNTPVCPDIVAFYARTAAFEGSQTTICDGRAVFGGFDADMQARWRRKITVKRNLPQEMWHRYLVNEHPALSDASQIRPEHILQFQAAYPGQSFKMHEADGSLDYMLEIDPVRGSTLSGGLGFANAILGPSHNYEPPVYSFDDGEIVGQDEVEALRDIAEKHTVEINWQDGDIAILDNTRIMHGRRAIKDTNRELFIGMGCL